MPHYEESVISIFYELSKELYGSKVESFIEEKNKEEILINDEIDLGIRGRADLVIESDRNKYIIDIKTLSESSILIRSSFKYYIIYHSIFAKEMKAFYSAILIFEETPNASPISAIKNSTDVPP